MSLGHASGYTLALQAGVGLKAAKPGGLRLYFNE
jgi:hypothetical protein